MRRVEWNMIRRLLGKPRRCSAAFFAEERESLEAKREKVRILQRGGALPAEQATWEQFFSDLFFRFFIWSSD